MTGDRYPLDGYRVVEISQIWAAPQLASSLGDMGAEVIRVESMASTDVARVGGAVKHEYRISLDYQRHARSRAAYVTLNIREPEGMAYFHDLLRTADVFVCNLSPRVLKKLKLTYADVRRLRPDIVMVTISAAGQDGPWSDLVAFGPAMNAVVGSDLLVGYPGDDVFMSSYWDADPAMGMAASYAVFLALYRREETGEGRAHGHELRRIPHGAARRAHRRDADDGAEPDAAGEPASLAVAARRLPHVGGGPLGRHRRGEGGGVGRAVRRDRPP